MKIALLEGDTHHADHVGEWLRSAGYGTVVYSSPKTFLRELGRDTCDVVIVGGCTAELSATELLLRVRELTPSMIPLMRICEESSELDIVAALKAGADDCMAWPLRRMEFLARIEALGRRLPKAAKRVDLLTFGDLSVDLQNRVILRAGQRISLTPKSYDLAVFLFSNLGQLMSRTYLMERIWGRGSSTSTRTLDTHISRLRTDLGLIPENGWMLQSVYQHGYRLEQIEEQPRSS